MRWHGRKKTKSNSLNQNEPYSPNPRWKRNLWGVWFVVFISISGANLVFPFMPLYLKEDIGVQGEGSIALWAGLLGTATGAMMFIFSPIWGSVADRYGRKPMLLRAVIGAMIVMFLQGLAQEPWQLLILRAFQGMFAGTVGAATALVAASTPRREMSYSMGLIQTGMFSAQMIGPLIGGVLAATIGFRMTFIGTSALYGVGAIVVLFMVEETNTYSATHKHREPNPVKAVAHNLRAVAAQSGLMMVILILWLLNMSNSLVRPIVSLVVDSVTDERVAFNAGIVMAALALTSTVAALSVARATRALGYRRWLMVAAFGAATCYLPVAMANSVLALALLMAAVGLFSGAMLPTTNSLIGALTPDGLHGSSFGLASSAQALSQAVGPLIGGSLAAVFGIHAGFIASAVVLYVAALLAYRFVREPVGESSASAVARQLAVRDM